MPSNITAVHELFQTLIVCREDGKEFRVEILKYQMMRGLISAYTHTASVYSSDGRKLDLPEMRSNYLPELIDRVETAVANL